MKGRRIALPALCLASTLVLVLAGCSGLDYMIEEYNSRFGIHEERLMPGDLGYDQNDMIEPDYHVNEKHSLSIPAPQSKGATYLWEVFRVQDGKVVGLSDLEKEAQTFQIELSGRMTVGTYRLRLTMTVNGRSYVDEAMVTVHTDVVVPTN